MTFKIPTSAPLAAALVAAACVATPALAAGEAGMVVTQDAETGQLRAPTAAEMKTLGAAAAKAGSTARGGTAATPVRHANGMLSVALGEDQMMYSVARVNAQGKVERVCVQGADASQRALNAPASFASQPQATRVARTAPVTQFAKEPLDEK